MSEPLPEQAGIGPPRGNCDQMRPFRGDDIAPPLQDALKVLPEPEAGVRVDVISV